MATETEKYSGLRLADRKIAAKRWDELMTGKKFTAFSSLTAASESTSIVAIGVLYERGLAKTSANGGRFAHWSLTDLCFPQPRLLKLLLMGEAFETWDLDLGKSVKYGAIFAILNPAALPSSKSSGTGNETLVSAKITHSTQLVLLGTCPSLGFCKCRKKDGLPCSMPCDIDRSGGALVCFYHTMQQEADKVRKWSTKNTTASRGKDASTPGLIVKEGPALRAPQRPRPGDRVAKDPALERLLSGRLPATPARKTSAAAKAVPTPPGSQPPASPAKRQPSPSVASSTQAAPKRDSWTSAPSQRAAPRELEQADGAAHDAARQILALFPDGIPAPDPNRPMESRMQFERASFEALRRREEGGGARVPSAPATLSPPQNLAQSKGVSKDNSEYSSKPCSTSAPTVPATAPPPAPVSLRQLESDFGRKVARQLAFKADPRLDLVRQQSSRFQSAMEEERAAKRMRRLHELEAMDAAQEVMEEIKSMKVRAWRCANCFSTFESFDQLKSCQEKGHKVTEKEATKTRWECGSCRHSESVLDRQLPSYCRSCSGCNWKQVSLRKVQRAAPVEKDLLLARGEELPFLNSIHIPDVISKAPQKQAREAHDDYEGL